MAIHKLKKHQREIPYEMVSREVAQSIANPNALAIWLYLLTKPEDWTVRRNDIKNHFGIGDQSYSKAMNYLYDNKLCKREVIQGGDGKIANTVIHVHSTPYEQATVLPENPQHGETVIRESGKLTENRVITEKDIGTDKPSRNRDSVPYDSITEIYNESVSGVLPTVRGELNDKRKRAAKRVYNYLEKDLDKLRSYLEYFAENATPYQKGENPTNWKAHFIYVMDPEQIDRAREAV